MKTLRGLLLFVAILYAQGSRAQALLTNNFHNAFTFNLGQYVVNELNLGFEHFFSEKRSIEINGGLIYRNEFWMTAAKDWVNSQYFNEHGFAARFLYKVYKKTGTKNNKYFYSFGVNYQYLYFDNEWIESGQKMDIKFSTGEKVTTDEQIFRHRLRHRFGGQLLLGNMYPLGKAWALELYYGLGLRAIYADRFDVERGGLVDGEMITVKTLNFEDQQFYIRPSIHAGVKLKLGW